VAGRDITEGRGSNVADVGYAIAVDVGVLSSASIWQNTDIAYDVALGGMPFIYAISDTKPYVRQTAPYRKEQFDNQTEPGEQSLTGFLLRSQSSFHEGAGITFYDPALIPGEGTSRFAESKGVDVWTEGEVTLLNDTLEVYSTSNTPAIIGTDDGTNDCIIFSDGVDLKKITMSGDTATTSTYTVSPAQTTDTFVSITTDGTRYFAACSSGIYVGVTSATTSDGVINAVGTNDVIVKFAKQRLMAGVANGIYELNPNTTPSTTLPGTALPTAEFTHPSSTWTWTSICEGPNAFYYAGKNRTNSAIFKIGLTTGTTALGFPVLAVPTEIAQFPVTEVVNAIDVYLGTFMVICTSKGVRVAAVQDDGSIKYGPIIVEGDFKGVAFRDRFAYVSGLVDGEAGLVRIDLSNDLGTLQFPFAFDAIASGTTSTAVSVGFLGNSDRVAFAVAGDGIWIEKDGTKVASGFLQTGFIRYNTLEPKNFKRLIGRGEFTFGSMSLNTVASDGTVFDVVSYDVSVPAVEVTTSQPAGAQEFIAYKFILTKDGTDGTKGPTFKGYQAKATFATPRQRIIKFPVFCFDVETDKYNVMVGYEGRANDRILELEAIEENGDVVTWQDLQTGENRQVVIEQITFTRMTSPDRGFSGYGGTLDILVRTV
jgi:hypothetical protein